jgi:hypothetical protein
MPNPYVVVPQKRPTPFQLRCYAKGNAWIRKHYEQLLAYGWTRKELRRWHRWKPGLAWSRWWRDNLVVDVGLSSGDVEFHLVNGAILKARPSAKTMPKPK